MTWTSAAAVATGAVVGAVASFVLALYAEPWARWYGPDQGGAKLFSWPACGLVAGAAVGFLVARALGAPPSHASPRTLGVVAVAVVALVAAAGLTGWALADVPPQVDGEQLLLSVEVRWPASQVERPSPTRGARLVFLRPGAREGRGTGRGVLWADEARRDAEGRWVAAGAVPVSTRRGPRAVDVVLDDAREHETTHRVALPLRGRPRRADLGRWSAWLPGAGGVEMRYRVQPRTQPTRTDVFGAFEVDATAGYYRSRWAEPITDGELTVRHAGRPFVDARYAGEPGRFAAQPIVAAAAIDGARPALLVARGVNAPISLLVDDGARVRAVDVTTSAEAGLIAHRLTNDATEFRAEQGAARGGRLDRALLATPGTYLVGDALLDTRTLAVRRLPGDERAMVVSSVPPLAVSPDGNAVVRYAARTGSAEPALLVADAATRRTHVVPVEAAWLADVPLDALDPAWVARHYEWRREADGSYRLRARAARAAGLGAGGQGLG